ncbi:hypothetical protein C8R46DRAFT_285291 [Mycena filopes]|nr:hypothetical protein C8R46DRAFT_285291 [Mycena filopes]
MAMLPLELFQAIIKDLGDDPSIFALRLVSKSYNSVVTPGAFRRVVVSDSEKSAAAVAFLEGCDESLTSHVREVVFQGTSGSVSWEIEETSGEGEKRREALRNTFSGLAKFSRLENLRLDFHDFYEEDMNPDDEEVENPSHFFLLQHQIFAGLAENPPSALRSMTLLNLIAVPDNIYAEEGFQQIFRSLQTLHISGLSSCADEGAHMYESARIFWDQSVPHIVRSAPALTALTLDSDMPIGAHAAPAISFAGIHLPHLTSLTLHQFVPIPHIDDYDVVDFILEHKATLRRLAFHRPSLDCGMVDFGADAEFTRPWHDVFAVFEAELGELREFVFEGDRYVDEDTPWRDARFKYTKEDPGWGYLRWTERIVGEEQDLPALESLLATISSRREGAL